MSDIVERSNKAADLIIADTVLEHAKVESYAEGYAQGWREGAEKMREDAAGDADKCGVQNREAEIKAARRGDYVGHDILSSCRMEADAIAARIRALPIPEPGEKK